MKFTAMVRACCPCGVWFEGGQDELGRPVAVHGLPMCRDFMDRTTEEYARWLRGVLGRRRGLA